MPLTPHKALKSLLAGRSEPDKQLSVFRPYAHPALVRMPVTGEPQAIDDLVQVFLVRLMRCKQADRIVMPIPEFLELTEKELHAELGERFKRLADQLAPRWKRVKDIRDLVTSVLARLPPPQVNPPRSLLVHAVLSRDLVADAVAWVLDFHKMKRDVRAITWKLVFMYEPADPAAEDAPPETIKATPDMVLEKHMEAFRMAQFLAADVGEEEAHLLMRRLAGETVLHMSTADQVPVAGLQGTLRRVEGQLRAMVRLEELDPHPNQLSLEALAQRVSAQRAKERRSR